MSLKTELLAGVGEVEAACVQLAEAWQGYTGAYQLLARQTFQQTPGSVEQGLNAQTTLDQAIGLQILARVIVQRLRTLGLEGVLLEARLMVAAPAISVTWVEDWQTRIARAIPHHERRAQ